VECQGKGTKARWHATNVECDDDSLGDSKASAYQVFEAGGFRMFGAYGNVKEYTRKDSLTGAPGFDSEGEIVGLREVISQESADALAETEHNRELAIQALICAVAKNRPVTSDRQAFALRRAAELAVESGTHGIALAEIASDDIERRLARKHTDSLVEAGEIARLEIADSLASQPAWNRVDSRCEGLTGADGELETDNIGERDPSDDGRMVDLGEVDMKGYASLRQERFRECMRFVARCYLYGDERKLETARNAWTSRYDASVRDCLTALKRKGDTERSKRTPDWHGLYLTRMMMEILGCKATNPVARGLASLGDSLARVGLVAFAGVPSRDSMPNLRTSTTVPRRATMLRQSRPALASASIPAGDAV
jgi:hypothetical protein